MKLSCRQYIIAIFISFILCLNTACSAFEYKIQNEEEATAVYKCTDSNMLGLLKVAVFEDKVVLIFAKSKNDRYKYGHLANVTKLGIDKAQGRVSLSNVTGSCTGVEAIDIDNGTYVVTLSYSYDKYIVNPDEPCEVKGAGIADCNIAFNEGNLELSYTLQGGDCDEVFTQTYNKDIKKWSPVKEEKILFSLESE